MIKKRYPTLKNLYIALFVCFFVSFINGQTNNVQDLNSDRTLSYSVGKPAINYTILAVEQKNSRLSFCKKKRETKRILGKLKDSINAQYGLYEDAPCVNSGPCGNFANLFYQKWNKRFEQKVSISFVMSPDSSECYHVLIKLPNGDYYDGGNGILTRKYIVQGYNEGMYIIDMLSYDYELLEEMSYGLERPYPRCPNYSVDKTAEIIGFHLDELSRVLN